jgi:catalase
LTDAITPEHAVDFLTGRFGRHPGHRTLHAKGTLCRASFTPTPEAGRLTRAAHMQGQPVEALVRFSNGAGDPDLPDHAPDVRGLAVKFLLPDGSRTDISAQTVPRFPVSTPEGFIELLRVNSVRGIPRLWRLLRFTTNHPGATRTAKLNAEALRPPSSYAGITYYAVHAFKWIDAHGGERYVRYRFEPEEEEPRLAVIEARKQGPDYLQQELRERLRKGPIKFTLVLQLAGEGDEVDDPSAAWPEDRETVTAGTLRVTSLETEYEHDHVLVFDPTRLTDGIEASNDPVLLFRPRAYEVSVKRRTAGDS